MKNIIGIDIGGTNIRIGVVNENNEVSCFKKIYQKEVFTSDNNVELLADFIKNYIKDNGYEGTIKAIAVGLPAPVSKDERICLQAPNIKGFDNTDVASILEEHLSIKTHVLKDVWYQIVYDMDVLGLADEEVVMAAYIGTGIGNAIAFEGKVYKGYNGSSCELGHIPVEGNTRKCGCGNIGCSETIAGGLYLANVAKERNVDISKVLVECKDIVNEFIEHVAMIITTEINILDPSCIILGGGVLEMEGFDKDLLEERIHFYARKPFPEQNLRIYYCNDDVYRGVIGAAMYVRNKME